MNWPERQDYNEAMQNPHLSLLDPDLKKGRPDITPLGLPTPFAGRFANVYRMHCGERIWGVKCFLLEFKDQQERYEAIHRLLLDYRPPCAIEFTFLPQGIYIHGHRYPILKMEWVEGDNLLAYINKNYRDRPSMERLAEHWKQMMETLQQGRIAHGDLQHGNILVINNDLRLIDYDGMYVPELRGRDSHELGHHNYQHPKRSEKDFGDYLDNFPALAIYISLLGISVDPRLWENYHDGDEQLLFRKKDFDNPTNSHILHRLDLTNDNRIQELVAKLRSYCAFSDLSKIPPFSHHLINDSPWWSKPFIHEELPSKYAESPPAVKPTLESPDTPSFPSKPKRQIVITSFREAFIFSIIGAAIGFFYAFYELKIPLDRFNIALALDLLSTESALILSEAGAVIGFMGGAMRGAFQPIDLFRKTNYIRLNVMISVMMGSFYGVIFGTALYFLLLEQFPATRLDQNGPIPIIGSYLATIIALSKIKKVFTDRRPRMTLTGPALGVLLTTMAALSQLIGLFIFDDIHNLKPPLSFNALSYSLGWAIGIGALVGFIGSMRKS